MIHFTSDTHFGHRNIIKLQPRPEFIRGEVLDIDAMNAEMIRRWNEKVALCDTVYHVGDFGWHNTDGLYEIMQQLNGAIYLIPGNHDYDLLKDDRLRERFERILPYSMWETDINGQHIHFSHFPIWEWNAITRGTWHLHGHLHAAPHGIEGKIMDVGCDGNNLYPYSFEEVKAYMDSRPIRTHHGRDDA